MRIAIIADPLDNQNAGVHVYTKSLITELSKRKDQHEYILIRQKNDTQFDNLEQIVISQIAIPVIYTVLRLFFIIPYILRKNKVDIVIEPAHFGPFNLPKKIKRITIIHDLTPILFPQFHRWHSQFLQNLFLPSILKKADQIITNSKNTSKDLERIYPITKSKNIAILLGKEDFYKPTYDEAVLKEIDISKPYFLFVGTVEPRKNLVTLLDAFKDFCHDTTFKHELIVAGGIGWKCEEFLTKLKSHPYRGRIKMLGFVDKSILPTLYTSATAFIYPSIYEGFGFPILEALSCGAPVICSDNSSLPEVGGDIAHYFDPKSAKELSSIMINICSYSDEYRKELFENSLNRASNFSWKKYTDLFIESLEKL